jgi:ABC-type nitrate/sulfonate/bicarbonate transport system ATPase subunit
MSAFVGVYNVTLNYEDRSRGVLALRDTSLEVQRGEFAAVVGPSGCGKSSLLKLVTGLVSPNSGEIVVFGDKVRGPVKIAGMAFQNPNLLPWRSVIDNVLLPLEIVEPHRRRFRQNKAGFRAEAAALLASVGLDGFGERYPWELSGGMQQRVSLCRALIHQPALLMLDEPFASLKVAITLAFIGTVLSEAIAANAGLGALMAQAGANFQMPIVFAGLVLLAAEGIAMYAVFAYVEIRWAPWAFRSSTRAGA